MSYTLQTNATFSFSKGFVISYSHVMRQINPQRMALYMRGYVIAKGSALAGSSLLITRCSFMQQGYWNNRKKNCETKKKREYFTLKWRGCYLYDRVLRDDFKSNLKFYLKYIFVARAITRVTYAFVDAISLLELDLRITLASARKSSSNKLTALSTV